MFVAIVDDDREVRESTQFLLGLHDIQADAFACGEDLFADDPARYSFLLIDYQMRNSTGIEILVELRRRGCTTPAALMTASFSPALRDRALSVGACEVFEKPLDEDKLIAVIRNARPAPQYH